VIVEYQAVCAEIDMSYKVGHTFVKDGKLYTKETPSGAPGELIYLVDQNQLISASTGKIPI
jgi:hypothetical protein